VSTYNLNAIIGEPPVISGSKSCRVVEIEVDDTYIGLGGLFGTVAAM
jgi:hypothetical protein